MILINNFAEYKILDIANGEKLEKWGEYTLVRPDPQIVWSKKSTNLWNDVHASYKRSNTGGGAWSINKNLPSSKLSRFKI